MGTIMTMSATAKGTLTSTNFTDSSTGAALLKLPIIKPRKRKRVVWLSFRRLEEERPLFPSAIVRPSRVAENEEMSEASTYRFPLRG